MKRIPEKLLRARLPWLIFPFLAVGIIVGATLPADYFRLIEQGSLRVKARLASEANANLKSLESTPGWTHFPYAILGPAVLYAKQHPSNPRYQDPDMLELALQIGDLLATEDEAGNYAPRLDSDWDTYMWLEAYRLLEEQLGDARKERWSKALERNVELVFEDARDRINFPWYNT